MTDLQEKGICSEGPGPYDGLPGVRQVCGSFDGRGLRVALVVSRYNGELTGALLSHAVARLEEHGVALDCISVCWVPGAFEIPLVLSRLAAKGGFSALIALGAIVEGETNHADVIAREIAAAVSRISLEFGLPVIDTVVAAPSLEQVAARCIPLDTGRGAYAADAAVEMARLLDNLG